MYVCASVCIVNNSECIRVYVCVIFTLVGVLGCACICVSVFVCIMNISECLCVFVCVINNSECI